MGLAVRGLGVGFSVFDSDDRTDDRADVFAIFDVEGALKFAGVGFSVWSRRVADVGSSVMSPNFVGVGFLVCFNEDGVSDGDSVEPYFEV